MSADDKVIEVDDDPKYRIAYDVERCKVGCVLIQAALGGDVPPALFHNYFKTYKSWTINVIGCQVYPIRRSQLPMLAARTSFDRDEGRP